MNLLRRLFGGKRGGRGHDDEVIEIAYGRLREALIQQFGSGYERGLADARESTSHSNMEIPNHDCNSPTVTAL